MKEDDPQKKRQPPPLAAKKKRTPEERLRLVAEADQLPDDELGAFLRQEGLHEAQLNEWRTMVLKALEDRPRRRRRSPHEQKIRKLEGELQRKDKALAETAALLVLQGKAEALWGAEGASTPPKSVRKRSH